MAGDPVNPSHAGGIDPTPTADTDPPPDVGISRFPVAAIDDLPDDMRERIAAVAEKTGFVPNVLLTLTHRPEEWRAFFGYHDALMERDTPGLPKADRELIVVATSAINHCLYCVVAHGAILRIRSRNSRLADQVATDWRSAELDERQRAIVDAAVTLASEPDRITEAQRNALRDNGLTDDDVWDVGAITALFALSNRLAHWAGIRPNDEFYLMGRLPRDTR
jgi:uncharacterized peroxidase-related enzyme